MILDFPIRTSTVATQMKQRASIYNAPVPHAMWLGKAVSRLNTWAMKRPARGQEKDF
jgi:hypothetical protein